MLHLFKKHITIIVDREYDAIKLCDDLQHDIHCSQLKDLDWNYDEPLGKSFITFKSNIDIKFYEKYALESLNKYKSSHIVNGVIVLYK